MKHNTIILISIALLIILLLFLYTTLYSIDKIYLSSDYNLVRDGFYIYKNIINKSEIDIIKSHIERRDYKKTKSDLLNNPRLLEIIKNISPEYVFQDYIWIIEKSSVHTCHRDNNGDFFNKGQKHPSYTMIVYLEDMDKCLAVIPSSHKEKNSYFTDFAGNLVNLLCNKGDVILFNANLIHVGTLNSRDDNLRIQLKVTHKDDLKKISYYENFNKILNKDNNLPISLRKAQRNISCMFPGISNLTQSENIMSSRGSDNGAKIGIGQKIFSYLFYGDVKFYDLPNIDSL
uniref:Phytanoyl-CoA dioxygenase n=1 Tax=viral metagenome TaxID=1070528 RepID=A0A6C0JKI1_9ZZZZ